MRDERLVQGSRLLNSGGSALGLNSHDLIGAMVVLVAASEILRPFGIEFISVPAGISSLVFLVPLRLKYRRKIIRDTLTYFLMPKVVHDPKRSSA